MDGDPSTVFDANDHAYISTLIYGTYSPLGIHIQSSDNGGANWININDPTDNTGTDKDMIACDNESLIPYHNYLYCGWRDINGHINIASLVSGGQIFSSPTIFTDTGQGVDIQTAPNGNVYAVWAHYSSSNAITASGLGFSYSTNGGQSFYPQVVAFNYTGIATDGSQPDPVFNNIRVNDCPSIAVDKSCVHPGRIYVVFLQKYPIRQLFSYVILMIQVPIGLLRLH